MRYFSYFHILYKSVIDYYALCSAFACTLYFKHIHVVYKFPEKRRGQPVLYIQALDVKNQLADQINEKLSLDKTGNMAIIVGLYWRIFTHACFSVFH